MRATLLLLGLLLASCGSDRNAGTGSQTGNSVVAGRIVHADSTPASRVAVTMSPATWMQDSGDGVARSTTTNSEGVYRFEGIPPGLWRLESYGSGTAMVRTLRTQADHDTTLPALVAKPTGNLVAEVHLDDTLRAGSLVVPGTAISRPLATFHYEIYVTLQGLAPGEQYLVIRSKDGRTLREAHAFVRSGRTDTLRDPSWSRRVTGPQPDVY